MRKKMLAMGTVILVLLMTSAVFGQTNIGFNGVGATVGFVSPEGGIGSTIAFGVRADLGTVINPNVGFMAEILYWSKGYDESFLGGSWGWSYSSMYISALGKYSFGDPDASFVPYAAGGPGIVFGKVKSEWKGETFPYKAIPGAESVTSVESSSISNTDIVIHIIGGVDYRFSPSMKGFAEVRYTLGGWDFWGVFGGVMYNLKY